MKVAVILPAAGLGTRMGKGSAEKTGTSRKQFMLLEGSPILIHTVRKFAASDRVAEIVVAVRAEDLEWVGAMLAREFPGRRVRAVEGGNSRQQSVENALATLGPETRPGGGPRRGAAVHRSGNHSQGVRRSGRDRRRHRGRAGGGHGEAGEPRHRPRAHPGHPAAREAGDGADAAGVPLRSAGARLRAGPRRTASWARTRPAWWSAWTWK